MTHLMRRSILGAVLLGGASLVSLGIATVRAEESKQSAGQNQSPAGVLFRYDATRKAWRPVQPGSSVTSGDRLLALPGTRAEVELAGGLRLALWANTPEQADVPLMETVVRLEPQEKGEATLTLERGRIVLSHRGGKEQPEIHVRFLNQAYDVRLTDPEAEVLVDIFSRWPPGVPFSANPGPQDVPTAVSGVCVLKGDANLKYGANEYLLRAPPGPATFHWDSVRGADMTPRSRTALPSWARSDTATDASRRVQTAGERLSRGLASQPASVVLGDARNAADALERRLAVYWLGALDDVTGLLDALGDARHADVRDAAIETLRHWIGRATGQDGQVYRQLVDRRKYTPPQAETVLQLLHGFSREDQDRRDTYEGLIAYLRSGRLPIRALAWWHLSHWAPQLREQAPYDPAGDDQARDSAAKAWSRLLAEGKLPPRENREERK